MARRPRNSDRLAQNIVADGHVRARVGAEPEVRAAVSAAYAERLKASSLLGRIRLRREIEREIRRRLDEQSPPGALY